MSIPGPRGHDPQQDAAPEPAPEPAPAQPPESPTVRYTATTVYLCAMVTLILLAVLFEWRV